MLRCVLEMFGGIFVLFFSMLKIVCFSLVSFASSSRLLGGCSGLSNVYVGNRLSVFVFSGALLMTASHFSWYAVRQKFVSRSNSSLSLICCVRMNLGPRLRSSNSSLERDCDKSVTRGGDCGVAL